MVKACIFSIYVLMDEVDMAVMWAVDLYKMSSILTGPNSEDSKSWLSTTENLRNYFKDRENLSEVIKTWSLVI